MLHSALHWLIRTFFSLTSTLSSSSNFLKVCTRKNGKNATYAVKNFQKVPFRKKLPESIPESVSDALGHLLFVPRASIANIQLCFGIVCRSI